jgi:hypothetical protein
MDYKKRNLNHFNSSEKGTPLTLSFELNTLFLAFLFLITILFVFSIFYYLTEQLATLNMAVSRLQSDLLALSANNEALRLKNEALTSTLVELKAELIKVNKAGPLTISSDAYKIYLINTALIFIGALFFIGISYYSLYYVSGVLTNNVLYKGITSINTLTLGWFKNLQKTLPDVDTLPSNTFIDSANNTIRITIDGVACKIDVKLAGSVEFETLDTILQLYNQMSTSMSNSLIDTSLALSNNSSSSAGSSIPDIPGGLFGALGALPL